MNIVYGIGINDSKGEVVYYEEGIKKTIKSYLTWKHMLERCYSEKYQEKRPSYKGCSVSKEWLLYSNFKKWFDKNYPIELDKNISFHLDKDLLFKGNKIYSKEKCIFLPQRINSFISNKKSNNTTGYNGVCFRKNTKKFFSQIRGFKTLKNKHLGYFDDPIEASKAYEKAREYMSILAREYMRNLGIYSEEIINKIKE